MIRRAVDLHQDPAKAIKYAVDHLTTHEAIRNAIITDLVTKAVGAMVYDRRHCVMKTLKQSARGVGAIAAAAEVRCAAFLDSWIMPDGLPLGDWTGPRLLIQSRDDRLTARGMRNRAAYFEELAKLCGDLPVREKVQDEDARELWRRVENKRPAAITTAA